jgi:hypothetical protein
VTGPPGAARAGLDRRVHHDSWKAILLGAALDAETEREVRPPPDE